MTYAGCKSDVKPKLHPAAFPPYIGCAIVVSMAHRPTYLAQWRQFRGLTQAQVIDRLLAFQDGLIPTTAASLSRIENGRQVYNQRILEALADIYNTDPGALLINDPTKEGKVLDLLARLPAQDREQAEAMLEAMARVAESRAVFTPAAPPSARLEARKTN